VGVDVDEAGGDVEAGDVDDLEGLGRVDAGGDGGHLAARDGDVAHGVDPVPGIDDVPAAQQDVVLRLRGRSLRARRNRGRQRQHEDGGQVHTNHSHQPLRAARRRADQRPLRYSPMSRVPPISSPVTVPLNV
jgi:hypothetical protein